MKVHLNDKQDFYDFLNVTIFNYYLEKSIKGGKFYFINLLKNLFYNILYNKFFSL